MPWKNVITTWLSSDVQQSHDHEGGAGAPLVVKAASRRRVVHRDRLLLQPGELPLQVVHEKVGHVVREAAFHDDAKRGEVLPVLRERVRRQQPAVLTERVRRVEDGVVADRVAQFESEDRQLVALVRSSKGPSSAICADRRVATSRAYCCTRR